MDIVFEYVWVMKLDLQTKTVFCTVLQQNYLSFNKCNSKLFKLQLNRRKAFTALVDCKTLPKRFFSFLSRKKYFTKQRILLPPKSSSTECVEYSWAILNSIKYCISHNFGCSIRLWLAVKIPF